MNGKLLGSVFMLFLTSVSAVLVNYYTAEMPEVIQKNHTYLVLSIILIFIIQAIYTIKTTELNTRIEDKVNLYTNEKVYELTEQIDTKGILWLGEKIAESDESIINFEGYYIEYVNNLSEALNKMHGKKFNALVISENISIGQFHLLKSKIKLSLFLFRISNSAYSYLPDIDLPHIDNIHDLLNNLNSRKMFN